MWLFLLVGCSSLVYAQNNLQQPGQQYDYAGNPNYMSNEIFYDFKCPQYWIQHYSSCYRFVKSPQRNYHDARRVCQTFSVDAGGSDLVSISSSEEHSFLVQQLNVIDPQHRRWYIGAHQQQPNYWANPDGTQLTNMENAFLPENEPYGKDYLAYNFTRNVLHWSLQLVRGDEPFFFICEANIAAVQRLVSDDRDYMYGVDIADRKTIPRGPYFIKQPKDITFDDSMPTPYNVTSLSCLAGGYPEPTYEWFREYYENDRLVARKINPLDDSRYTVSGGDLMIYQPQQKKDYATYHCKATNKFGTIISESVQLNFGFILEFVLKRSPESGEQNWGKSIYCDPPAYFPAVKYSWSRDYFPNFVEEDKRVFVSYDGALYFSALETIDRATYSCSVRSDFSDSGRNGPFFPLMVNPHSSYQQLKFPNSFPKAFPEAPVAGREVRLECVAFGYPVPSYNWTRKGAPLPKNSYLTSYNRVLVIPHVEVDDQGEYICRAYNDRSSIADSVILDIQAEPNFTIPLMDKHIDRRGELVWTCEAFGIPDVNYTWWKDGRQLVMGYLPQEDRGRINIQDNVLTISPVDEDRDPGMYQCRAANTLKTKYSSAQLRVLSFKPSFKKHPVESETYAAEHGNVTIKCNPEAAPKPEFIWKKDGNVIGSGGHRRILKNGNLVISPVSRDDEGVYTCTASNHLGLDESKGRLIVLRGPQLMRGLQPRTVTALGSSFSLNCQAYTEEMLDMAYVWNHRSMRIRDIDIKNSGNRIFVDGGYISVVNVTFPDAGEYECVVKSAVGQISSKTYVVVEGPPGPPGGLQVVSIQKNSAVIQWTDGGSHGSQIISYTISGKTNWNSSWVNISHNVHAEEVERYTGRKEATIENVLTPWSVYEFRVAAWNSIGMGVPSAPSPKHSTPPDRPYIFPQNIAGGGGKRGDLTITWEPLRNDQQNGPGIHYKVFWKKMYEEPEFQSLELKDFGNTGMAVVSISLDDYYTQYIVKVQAMNDVGEGPISNERIVYSAEDMPQAAPQLVSARSFNSTALNVTWQPIAQDRETVRGKLIGYRIKYWKLETSEADSVYYLSRTIRPWALIVGLQPDTQYFVKVMAFNGAGEGPESERFIERTYMKAPQNAPSTVHAEPINPSTIRVTWRYVQPSVQEEPIQGYKIRVWEFDQPLSSANDTIVHTGERLEGYVTGLQPGKAYRMRVLAYSNGGDGRMSSPEKRFQMGSRDALGLTNSGTQLCPVPLVALILISSYIFIFERKF